MEVEMKMGMRGLRFLEERREWKLPGLLYADDLVMCGKLEEDLKAMVGSYVEVCRRRGLQVNAGKSKVMVVNGEDGLECEVRIRLEYVSELNIWDVFWMDESGTNEAVSKEGGMWEKGYKCH